MTITCLPQILNMAAYLLLSGDVGLSKSGWYRRGQIVDRSCQYCCQRRR